jgi:hypothetical protein
MVIGQTAWCPFIATADASRDALPALAVGHHKLRLAAPLPLPGAGGAPGSLQAAISAACSAALGDSSAPGLLVAPSLQWRALLGDVAARQVPDVRLEFELHAADAGTASGAATEGAADEAVAAGERLVAEPSQKSVRVQLLQPGYGTAAETEPISNGSPQAATQASGQAGGRDKQGAGHGSAAAGAAQDAVQRSDQAASALEAAAAVTPGGSLPLRGGSLRGQLQWKDDASDGADESSSSRWSGGGRPGGSGAMGGLAGAMQTQIDRLAEAVEGLKEVTGSDGGLGVGWAGCSC